MSKRLFFGLLCLALSSRAQTTNDFVESFFFFPKNSSLLVPAFYGVDVDGQVTIAYKSYAGQLSALRCYMADLSYNVQKGEKSFPLYNKHLLGGGIYSQKEGEFFDRNRVFFHYTWHKKLTDELSLSAGSSLHVINYVFKSSSAGSNGSAFSWSGNIGAAIYTSSFLCGISANDFNSPTVKPVDYVFVLYPNYVVHAEKKLQIGPQTELKGSVRAIAVPKGQSFGMCHVGITMSERVGIHGFLYTLQGWGIALDLPHVEINDSWLDLSFAYKVPYPNSTRPPYSLYEIHVGYYFNKKGG